MITQVMSYGTSLAAVAWVVQPTTNQGWAITSAIALLLEVVLIVCKEMLFDGSTSNDPIGWGGFIFDAVINTGGALIIAPRILTFPAIAAILGLFGLNLADPTTNTIASLIFAFVVGVTLSIAPHRLWRAGRG